MSIGKTTWLCILSYVGLLCLGSMLSGTGDIAIFWGYFGLFIFISIWSEMGFSSRKSVITFFTVCICLYYFLSVFPYMAEYGNPINDYAKITDIEYKAVLVDEPNQQSRVVVTEKLTYDIHAASKNNLFWELWRDLPEDSIDGVRRSYKVNYVKQLHDDGTITSYKEANQLYYYDSQYSSAPERWFYANRHYNDEYDEYECVMIYIPGTYREKLTFEIQYEIYSPALYYGDCSELYLTFYDDDTIVNLNSFKADILIADSDMPVKGNYRALTYGTASDTFEVTESRTKNPGYHTFSIDLDESELKFNTFNRYLELSIVGFGNDHRKLTNSAPRNIYADDVALEEILDEYEYYANLTNTQRSRKALILVITLIGSGIVILRVHSKIAKIKSKYTFFEPELHLQYYRDIPEDLDPMFAAELVFIKDRKNKSEDNYAALMLSLIRKKYIAVSKVDYMQDWTLENTLIEILHNPTTIFNPTPTTTLESLGIPSMISPSFNPPILPLVTVNDVLADQQENAAENDLEPLTKAEKLYFNLIMSHSFGRAITMKELERKISREAYSTNKFVTSMEEAPAEIGLEKGFFQKLRYQEPRLLLQSSAESLIIWGVFMAVVPNIVTYLSMLDFAFGGFFIFALACFYGAYIYYKNSYSAILLTREGEVEYEKWRGLYNFLNSETLMNERTHIELPIWEKYLVYATAFGISEKVIKALNIRCPEIAESPVLKQNFHSSSRFYSNSRSIRSHSHRTSSSFRSSFGGGGGRGGFGGGGGH